MSIEPLDGDNTRIGAAEIRAKLNEAIQGLNTAGGSAASSLVTQEEGSSEVVYGDVVLGSDLQHNASETYAPSSNSIISANGDNNFAVLIDGKLYITHGATDSRAYTFYTGESEENESDSGLDHMREFSLNGYYKNKPEVTVIDFYLSYGTSVVLMSDGILWGWGNNISGQLNQGHTSVVKTPVIVDTDVREVFYPKSVAPAGHAGYLALYWGKNLHYIDGKGYILIYGCGYNGQYQLSDGSTVSKSSAVSINANSDVSSAITYEQNKWRIKKVFNFGVVYGALFVVLQHDTDSRVEFVAACGYNAVGQLGMEGDVDNHQTKLQLATRRDSTSHPSWNPTWKMFNDTCAIDIIDIIAGYNGNSNLWVAVWSRVSCANGTQGDFLRTAGMGHYGELGAHSKDFGSQTSLNGGKYKTFKISDIYEAKENFPNDATISAMSNGATYEDAKYAASKTSGHSLAFIQNRSEYNRLHMFLLERAHNSTNGSHAHGHLLMDMKDDSAEGFWRSSGKYNLHKNAGIWMTSKTGSGQPDDAGGEVIPDGRYMVRGIGVGLWEDGPLQQENNGLAHHSYDTGTGFHDIISLGKDDASDNNYVLAASSYKFAGTGTEADPYKFGVRIWRSTTSGDISWASVSTWANNKCRINHPDGEGLGMHYYNPHVGKFVQFHDSGDVGYLVFDQDTEEFIFARSVKSGTEWKYYRSDIGSSSTSVSNLSGDVGVSSIVYLGDGVLVATTIGIRGDSGPMGGFGSKQVVIRSLDYGTTWHIISDNRELNFNGVDIAGRVCSGFFCGSYYDVISNKYRLLISGCTGSLGAIGMKSTMGTTIINPFGNDYHDAFFLIYSDDLGDNWSVCTIDGTQVNWAVTGTSTEELGDLICGFAQQQESLVITRTRHLPTDSNYSLNKDRGDGENISWNNAQTLAYPYNSLDGGKTFSSFPGIVTEGNLVKSRGGELNIGLGGQTTDGALRARCSYRIITKVLPYATDGVIISWARMSSQIFGKDNASAFYDSNNEDPLNSINTDYRNEDYWQAPQRFTVLTNVRNRASNEQLCFLLNRHNITNVVYKQVADRGAHIYAIPRASKVNESKGNILIANGGYANNFVGNSPLLSANNKFPLNTEGEDVLHIRKTSHNENGELPASHNDIINYKGLTIFNDIPTTSNSAWSDYFGWVEQREIALATSNSSTICANSLDGSLTIDVAIPEINVMFDPSAEMIDVPTDRIFIKNIKSTGGYVGGLQILLSNGKLYSIGYGATGQRGAYIYNNQGLTTNSINWPTHVVLPNRTSNSHNWERILMCPRNHDPGYHTSVFVLDNNGDMWAWGWNVHGELGLGNALGAYQYEPVKVPLPQGVHPQIGGFMATHRVDDNNVNSSDITVVFVDSNGDMWAAGDNSDDQIMKNFVQHYSTRFIKIKNPFLQ